MTSLFTSTTSSFTYGYELYIACTSNSKAVYWKNGFEVDLAPQGVAQSIVVSGSDVYVGGYVNVSGMAQAAYWKNGKQVILGH